MSMKRIYGNGIYDNENAESTASDFVKFAIKQINSSVEWLSTTNEVAQDTLANIDLLLAITKQNPICTNLLLEKQEVLKWKTAFNDWYCRVYNKIPNEYRQAIKNNGEKLFNELEQYCNELTF